jgi:hypothetical protein
MASAAEICKTVRARVVRARNTKIHTTIGTLSVVPREDRTLMTEDKEDTTIWEEVVLREVDLEAQAAEEEALTAVINNRCAETMTMIL